jgi:hypothetical protein
MFFFGSHSWRGASGRRYRFKCVLTKAGLPPQGVGGIYVFVRRRWGFLMEPLYVGKAHELRSRLMGHEKWPRAFWYYGATERYVLGPIRDEVDRRRIEEDLIRGLKPRMNDMEIPQAKGAARAKRNAAASRAFDLSAILGKRPQQA